MAEQIRQDNDLPEMQLYPSVLGVGNILINPDVIARIAGIAVSEIENCMLDNKFSFADILPSKEPVKGITVSKGESDRYLITVEVKMAYGTPMFETAEKLQRHIKDTVERMVNLELDGVDVRITDIYNNKEKSEED